MTQPKTTPPPTHDLLGRHLETEMLRDFLFDHCCSMIGQMLESADLPQLEAMAEALRLERPSAERN